MWIRALVAIIWPTMVYASHTYCYIPLSLVYHLVDLQVDPNPPCALGFESRVSLSAGWRQNLSGAPLREPRQAMAGMDEPDDAAKGSPMDAESTDAAVTDEVEPTTTSATDSGVDDKGEP